MQNKLPLKNNLLHHLSAIDPRAQGYSKTHQYLMKLIEEMNCNMETLQVDNFNRQQNYK